MLFQDTPLADAKLIDLEPFRDHRGFFARGYCVREFREAGIDFSIVNINHSMSVAKGSLRGLHYQKGEAAETKVVRCIRGAFYDVIVDLREGSPTYKQWYGTELSEENGKMLLVPKGFAHGFLTLTEKSEALYLTDQFYIPDAEAGLRWDDPEIGIEWPSEVDVISEKDKAWPNYS